MNSSPQNLASVHFSEFMTLIKKQVGQTLTLGKEGQIYIRHLIFFLKKKNMRVNSDRLLLNKIKLKIKENR